MNGELEEEQDEDYDDGVELYEWQATGESCVVCDALDDLTFTSAPVAVHPKCKCEVYPTGLPAPSFSNCENVWEVTASHSEWSIDDQLTMHVFVSVQCWNGTTITDIIDLDFGDGVDDINTFDDEIWNGVSDHVEELAAMNCPECEPFPNV